MIHVLHLFGSYLNTNENWSYRLIDGLVKCKVYIGSAAFLKNNFYPGKFVYVSYPLDSLIQYLRAGRKGTFNFFIKSIFLRFITLFFPGYTYYLKKSARIAKTEIIHSHFSFVGYEYMALAKHLKTPHVVSFYGFDYEWLPFNYPIWKKHYKELFRKADLFICEGTYSAALLQRIGCPATKIKVVRLGANPEKINFMLRSKKAGELSLLQVSAIHIKKGHKYTIEAFALAQQHCPNMTLTLVGNEGEAGNEKMIRDIIAENNVADKVKVMRGIDFEHLHKFMYDYQVFIHPSCHTPHKDCEGGAPVVLIDAQSTGMPVISTNHCDIPDVVLNEKTGLLTDEFNVKGLADHITRFYNMGQDEYDHFASNARKHVEQYYDISKNALELEKIYEDLISENKNHFEHNLISTPPVYMNG